MQEKMILRALAWALLCTVFCCGCDDGKGGGPPDDGAQDELPGDGLPDDGLPDPAGDPDAPDIPDDTGEEEQPPVTTYPDNILVNGGFELGLQCYSNWVWSQSGVDYRGDYDFWLSGDARTGDYALEIRCQGADCGDGAKAAIYSQRIPTSSGLAYSLSLHARCQAGAYTYLYVPQTSTGEFFQELTCNGDWALNEASFTAADGASSFYFYVYNASTTSLFIDDIVLTHADGTVPPQTVYHAGSRSVGLEGRAVTVDGAPYLALGFFNVPYEDLEQVAGIGANTVTGLGLDVSADCFNTEQPGYLDHAYELGVNVAPDSTFSARLDEPAVYPAIIGQFAGHRAVIAWFLVDEPDQADVAWYAIEPATLVAEYEAARGASAPPVVADFQRASWSDPSEVAPYAGAVDLWMAEPYGENFGGVTHAMDLFDGIEPRPVWLAQDAVAAGLVVPKAWWVVVQGATGILYFTWQEFAGDPARLEAAAQAFGELGQLGGVLFAESLDDQVTGPGELGFIARRLSGSIYVMAVKPDAGTVDAAFTVPGLTDGQQVTVMFEDRTLAASGESFTDTFDGIARHVYLIE